MGFWDLQNKEQNIYHASVHSPRTRATPLVQLENEHNTTLLMGQYNSHSRLLLSPYNASTLTVQSLKHSHRKKPYPVNHLPPPFSAPPPTAIYYKKRENMIYHHWVTYATPNTNMQNQQNSTTHYSLFSLLAVTIFFSFARDYNNKFLQQIMHDIINYLWR